MKIRLERDAVWVKHTEFSSMFYKCSACGRVIDATDRDFHLHLYDYCPKCGAKMEREKE